MSEALAALLRILELEQTGEGTFVGTSLPKVGERVFGGQVLAQSLVAAARTVDPARLPHSVHGYFLRPGAVSDPITFAVERLRDGRSFSARRTHAIQGDVPILSMITSFQAGQAGFEHADAMPVGVPGPDEVPSVLESLAYVDPRVAAFWTRSSPFDMRHVDGSLYLQPASTAANRQRVWMRALGHVPDDQALHRALLAYACDHVMLEPVLRRHGASWATPGLSAASLDHAMWWHRDVRVDEWLLFVQAAPSAQGGRGLGIAQVFSQDGSLVASIAQEGMLRLPG